MMVPTHQRYQVHHHERSTQQDENLRQDFQQQM
jgi:hypothetical protein